MTSVVKLTGSGVDCSDLDDKETVILSEFFGIETKILNNVK